MCVCILAKTDGTKIKRRANFNALLWHMVCDIYINKFLADIKFGESIHRSSSAVCPGTLNDDLSIYEYLVNAKITGFNNILNTAATGTCDLRGLDKLLTYREYAEEYN